MERIGTNYGGWVIPSPISLNSTSVIYSAGVGEDLSFDLELQCKTGATIWLIDPTQRSVKHYEEVIQYYESQSDFTGNIQPDYLSHLCVLDPDLSKLQYVNKGLWKNKTTLKFYKQTNESYVSQTFIPDLFGGNYDTVDAVSIRDLMMENDHKHIDLLKMDIEGAEVAVLNQMLDEEIYPKYILVEFDLYLKGKDTNRETDVLIQRLQQAGYSILANEKMNITFVKT